MNKRIKAFTLAETLVAMVISAIVIAFGYAGYGFIIKNFYRFGASNEKLRQTILFRTVVSNDISKAEYLTWSDAGLVMNLTGEKKITYIQEEDRMLRKCNGRTDTFKLKVTEINVSDRANKTTKKNKLVDNVKIEFELNGNKEVLSFQKIYGADQLIKEDDTSTETNDGWQ